MANKRRHGIDSYSHECYKRSKYWATAKNICPVTSNVVSQLRKVFKPDDDYRHITSSLRHVQVADGLGDEHAMYLCRTFSHLLMESRLQKFPGLSENETRVVIWLQLRYRDFNATLREKLCSQNRTVTDTALFLLMQLLRAEIESKPEEISYIYAHGGNLSELLSHLLQRCSSAVLDEFIDSYLRCYSDLWALTIKALNRLLLDREMSIHERYMENVFRLMKTFSEDVKDMSKILQLSRFGLGSNIAMFNGIKEVNQAWEQLLKIDVLDKAQRQVLEIVPTHIAPLIQKPEILLDFLSRCCNGSQTEALLALSGLACIIQLKSIDYPLLYYKLYEKMDVNALQKRQRSRLMRLLNQCLTSTHLSGALVASYMKRASRLCLYGPPASIIATAPLIYNLVQKHPICSIMLHRMQAIHHAPATIDENLADYNPSGSDPNHTGALRTSLWEMATLMSHWHPNAATVSKTIGEQFSRRSFNMEHFLDHSYRSILNIEIVKPVRKEPPIKHTVGKTILLCSVASVRQDIMSLLWDH